MPRSCCENLTTSATFVGYSSNGEIKPANTWSWTSSPLNCETLLCQKQRHYFANKGPSSQSYGFSSGHVWMWELDYKESWAPKNCCFWTVVLEKTLENPLDFKEIQLVHPKGNQSWIFIGRTGAKAGKKKKNSNIFSTHVAKSNPQDPDAGKDWRQEVKGTTDNEMVGWHHWLDGHEFEQAPGVGDGHRSLACCSPWGCRVRQWFS